MIINAHRELKEAGIDVGEIQFYDSSAEKYTKLLKENNRAVLLSENTPEMVQVLNFLENVGDKTKVYGGRVKRAGKEILRKSGEYIDEYGKRSINIVCENVKDGTQKLKRNLKKKITQIEFDASKWRGDLGAYFFTDCKASFSQNGTWSDYKIGSKAIA